MGIIEKEIPGMRKEFLKGGGTCKFYGGEAMIVEIKALEYQWAIYSGVEKGCSQ